MAIENPPQTCFGPLKGAPSTASIECPVKHGKEIQGTTDFSLFLVLYNHLFIWGPNFDLYPYNVYGIPSLGGSDESLKISCLQLF